MRWLVLLSAILGLAIHAPAATYVVNPDGTGDFPTIQAAIDACVDGDIVELTDGTFTGDGNRDVDFLGKAITVRSQGGNPATCIIDCEGSPSSPHRGFLFRCGETNSAIVAGLSIRGGCVRNDDGGAVHIDGASPTVRDCAIIANSAPDPFFRGGGIYMRASRARIENCEIASNQAMYGGGVAIRGGSAPMILDCTITGNVGGYGGGIDTGNISAPLIQGCRIAGNEAIEGFGDSGSGGGLVLGGDAAVEGCSISGNVSGFGGGAACWGGAPRVVRSTIACNDARTYRGGGLTAQNGTLALEGTVIWGNCAEVGEQFYVGSGGVLSVSCCVYDSSGVVEGNGQMIDLGGNLLTDPLFCDPVDCSASPTVAGDYSIHRDSPCVAANHPCGIWVGAHGVGCPPGAAPESGDVRAAEVLREIRPNPVCTRMEATIRLRHAAHLRAGIFDVNGRRICKLADSDLNAGDHALVWDPRDCLKRPASGAGIYLLRIESLGCVATRRLVVVR